MNKSLSVIVAFVGIFAAGGVTGGLLALRYVQARPVPVAAETVPSTPPAALPVAPTAATPTNPESAKPNPPAPEQLGPLLFRRLTNQLALTPEQKAKIRPIEARATEELNRLRRDSVHSTQVLIDKNEDEIRAELTPEQVAKFDEMVSRQRERIQRFVTDQQKRQREQRDRLLPKAPASPGP